MGVSQSAGISRAGRVGRVDGLALGAGLRGQMRIVRLTRSSGIAAIFNAGLNGKCIGTAGDIDGDGLPDSWEMSYFRNPRGR